MRKQASYRELVRNCNLLLEHNRIIKHNLKNAVSALVELYKIHPDSDAFANMNTVLLDTIKAEALK